MENAPTPPLLVMTEVHRRFGAQRALGGVSFDLNRGEVHALVGENGAGKSTLVKILSGSLRADQGRMAIEGEVYQPRNPRDARLAGVAMIYQEPTIAPHLTVEANVMLGQEESRLGLVRRREHEGRVREALRLLDYNDLGGGLLAGRLSVGAQQVVEIARALVSDARILILDEPTSSLTERDSLRLFQVIERLKRQGLGIIYISHFLEEVQRVADRYTVLRDGLSVASGAMAGTSLDTIVRHMVGREVNQLFPRIERQSGEPILILDRLSGWKLPHQASLTLRRGEVLGIAGLVGAGRSELLRAVFGLEPVRSGRVRVATIDATGGAPYRQIRRGLGLLSEDRKGEGLAQARSIEDNLTYSALGRHARLGWLDLRSRRRDVERWISALRIRSQGPDQPVQALSGGNQQKVALARLLYQQADVLLLDEPTRGIDVGSKAEVYRLIGELAAQGKAILMVSSYLPELLGVCDRVAVMCRGTLSAARPIADWTETSIMHLATGSESDTESESASERPGE